MEGEVFAVRAAQLDSLLLLSFASENPCLVRSAEEASKHWLQWGCCRLLCVARLCIPRASLSSGKAFPLAK